MGLNHKDLSVIHELIRNPNSDYRLLTNNLGLTRRQIDYSIEKINLYLSDNHVSKITKGASSSYALNDDTLDYLVQFLDFEQRNLHILSEEERVILILVALIVKQYEDISLLSLSDLLGISKNTVSADLKETEHFLIPFALSIHYSRVNGYSIQGNEIQLRKLIVKVANLLIKIYNNRDYFVTITGDDIREVTERIKLLETELKLHFSDDSFQALGYIIALNQARIAARNYLEEEVNIFIPEYAMNTYDFFKISEDIPMNEKRWLALQVLISNVVFNIHRNIDTDLTQATRDFIHNFEKKSYIVIEDKETFIERLVVHIQPAIYRILLDVSREHYIDINIDGNYRDLHNLVAESIHPLETYIGTALPKAEISYITIYIGGELLRQGLDLMNHKKAIIVCTSGMAISKILSYTLRELFPNFIFTDILSLRQFEHYDKDYDLVFSSDIVNSKKPVFIVNPIMSVEERARLRDRVLMVTKDYNRIDQIVDIVQKYADIKDESKLREMLNLELNFHGSSRQPKLIEPSQPDLHHYIKKEYIQIVDEALDWEEAVLLACRPLLDHGVIAPSYVEALIHGEESRKNHNLLGDHVAIPHADSSYGVHKDGFSMLLLKQRTDFNQTHSIALIVPLAIHNSTQHIKAIMQLYDLAKSEDLLERVMASSTADEIHELICGINSL